MSYTVSGSKQANKFVGIKGEFNNERGAIKSNSSVYKSSDEESVRITDSHGLSFYNSSGEYFDYSCDPCSTAGDHAEAQGYCTDCEEYLCDTCFRSHSRSGLLKHHILLDKDSMPRTNEQFCNPCHTAGDALQAVGYCRNCKEYLCSNCFRCHSRTKLMRNHNLIDIANMNTSSNQTVTELVTDLHIRKNVSGDTEVNEEFTSIRDVKIKVGKDKKECFITGITLVSNSQLVLCDDNNKCLKLVDTESRTIKDVLVLKAKPGGITTISDNQIAVVLDNKYQIQIISIIGGLTLDRSINTNGNCLSVKFTNGKIYVSFCQPIKFQILQPTGTIVKTIKPDSEVLKHCTLPLYIAISPDESVIYVSDWQTNKVLSMDMDGNMIAMYQDELEGPHDITVSPCGFVYLCNRDQDVVFKMTSDLSEATVILGPGDDLSAPYAICLNMDKQELYISSGDSSAKYKKSIRIYQWK